MYLLICAIDKCVQRYEIEQIINKKEEVLQLLWLTGENGSKAEISEAPSIGGSFSNLFRYQEENVMFAKIKGRDNVDRILGEIDKMDISKNYINYFVIPVVA